MPGGEPTGQITLNPILAQMKDLTGEMRDQGKLIAGLLISVQHLTDTSKTIEKTIQDVANAELSCPARQDNDRILKRISKLEALNHLKQTGEISVVTHNPELVEKQVNSVIIGLFARHWTKILPWIIAATIGLVSAAQQGWLPGSTKPVPTQRVVE